MNGIKPTESIIAYIDFLGTSKKIEQDKDNSYLSFLKTIYDFIEKELNNINEAYVNERYIKEIKIVLKNPMYIAALFTLAKMWKPL